tara:strand:- start:464 stop:592 length:129 start_codon:yes stop_codon:yes gene_type:complete
MAMPFDTAIPLCILKTPLQESLFLLGRGRNGDGGTDSPFLIK